MTTAAGIDTNLPADWFYYKRDLESSRQDKQHLDHNLFTVMPQIVTAPSPMLAAAQVNTMAEFDSALRYIVKSNACQAQKVLLVSGVNIDILPNHDEVFPLTKFAPWAACYKDEYGVGQVCEHTERVERLLAQPLDNPEQIDLEEVIAAHQRQNDFVGRKTCGSSQTVAYSIGVSCLNWGYSRVGCSIQAPRTVRA